MVDHIQINGVRDHAQEDSDVPTRLISEENTNGLESNNAFEGNRMWITMYSRQQC